MSGWGRRCAAGMVAFGLAAGCQGTDGEPEDQAAGQPVVGLVRVTKAVPESSSASKSASALCPKDREVISGGARIIGGGGEVRLTGLVPMATENGFRARADQDADGYKGVWGLQVYALCAEPVIGLAYLRSYSSGDYRQIKTAYAQCGEGSDLVGGGVEAPGSEKRVVSHFRLAGGDDAPGTLGQTIEVSGFSAQEEEPVAYAVCADPIGRFSTVDERVIAGADDDELTAEISCPQGLGLLGADIQAGRKSDSLFYFPSGEFAVTGLWADADLRTVTLTARRMKGSTEEWYLSGGARCGTVLQ